MEYHFSVPEFVGEFCPPPEFKVTRNDGSLLDIVAEARTLIENNSVEDLMNAGRDMKVKVNRKEVLAKIKENRKQHEKDYREALEGWIDEVKKETARAAQAAKKITLRKTLKEGTTAMLENIRVSLMPPRQFLQEYDQVIGMLEFCVDDIIELTGREINAWCYDRWQWKDEFTTSNAAYMSSR
jgi:hypothetical protein